MARLQASAPRGRCIRFAIEPNGRVSSASTLDTTLTDPSVSECIVAAFERWTFPRSSSKRATLVIFPLVLQPS